MKARGPGAPLDLQQAHCPELECRRWTKGQSALVAEHKGSQRAATHLNFRPKLEDRAVGTLVHFAQCLNPDSIKAAKVVLAFPGFLQEMVLDTRL